jgi:hypothetical protein
MRSERKKLRLLAALASKAFFQNSSVRRIALSLHGLG